MSRLKLDFSIDSLNGRKQFIDNYLNEITFAPTDDELEMMGNYILWGRDENGESPSKEGGIEIETRYKTWDAPTHESLDEMMEQPTFNEAILINRVPTKKQKFKFSREDALKEAPDYLVPVFKELFHKIDRLDLILNFYDLAHGKRKNEPREELINKFTFDEQQKLRAVAESLNQFKYLKMRHQLVELRNEQFTLRDSYVSQIQIQNAPVPLINEPLSFEGNVEVFPLGIVGSGIYGKIFLEEGKLNPFSFTQEELKIISDYYWMKQDQYLHKSGFYLDLRDSNHLIEIFKEYDLLTDAALDDFSVERFLLGKLLDTINYYTDLANLSVMHREILQWKIHKKTNREIQLYINKKYNKTYTENYISTIFRQKILPAIADAASYHEEIISKLWFEEEFKKCNCCGEIFLLSPRNFVHKARSKDGYGGRCKRCEKKVRQTK